MAPTFVILLHTGHGPDHFDLMLPAGEALATWQLQIDPADLPPDGEAPARRLPDHRTAYLTYEGPVSGGRGSVRRVDTGGFRLLDRDENSWTFELLGQRCRGTFHLTSQPAGSDRWTLRPAGPAPGR